MEHPVSRLIDITGLTVDDIIKKIVKKEISLNNLPLPERDAVIKAMREAENFANKPPPCEVLKRGIEKEDWSHQTQCWLCKAELKIRFTNLFLKPYGYGTSAFAICGYCDNEICVCIPDYMKLQIGQKENVNRSPVLLLMLALITLVMLSI